MRWPALPLLLLVAACTGTPVGVAPVTPFDADRYQGTWYEIARLDHSFERGLSNVTATYTPRGDGTLGVVNRGFDTAACAWQEIEGTARFLEGADVGSLAVTFFWPFAGGYHVFQLDQAGYGHAVIAGPTKDFLWVLARQPELPGDVLDALVEAARIRGFAVDELILVDHGPPDCPDEEAGARPGP